MKKNAYLNVRFAVSDRDRLQKQAESEGKTLSELIRERVELTPSLDPVVRRHVQELSESLGIPAHTVIQNMIVRVMAERQAREEVFGAAFSRVLEEFMQTDEGLLTGERLFDILLKKFREEYGREREEILLEIEASGVPLEENDRTFLISRRTGHAWLNSEEFREEHRERVRLWALASQAREQGVVPQDVRIDDDRLGLLWDIVRRGKLSEKGFRDRLEKMARSNPARFRDGEETE